MKIKSIFHSFWKAIIWWKIKNSGYVLWEWPLLLLSTFLVKVVYLCNTQHKPGFKPIERKNEWKILVLFWKKKLKSASAFKAAIRNRKPGIYHKDYKNCTLRTSVSCVYFTKSSVLPTSNSFLNHQEWCKGRCHSTWWLTDMILLYE